GLHLSAERDQLADEAGDLGRIDVLDHEPVVLSVPPTEATQTTPPVPAKASDLQSHPAVASEQFVEAPGGHGCPFVDDRDAVAYVLGLFEEVGVQEHAGPALAQAAND